MKYILGILVVTFFYSCGNPGQQNSDKDGEIKVAIMNDSQLIPSGAKKWTPTHEQIVLIEQVIDKAIKDSPEVNSQLKNARLSDFYRQYVCYIKGVDSNTYLNALCKINSKVGNVEWKKTLLVMDGAGKCNWQMKVDYSSKHAIFFAIDGETKQLR